MSEVAAKIDEEEKKSYTGSFAGPVLVFGGVIIIFISLVLGLSAYQAVSPYGMGKILFLYTGVAVLSGILFAGFGIVINLLREINHNLLNRQ